MRDLKFAVTPITLNSKDIFLIIQGNFNTSDEYVKNGVNEVLQLLTKFCGGEVIPLDNLVQT